MKKTALIGFALYALPLFAFAQTDSTQAAAVTLTPLQQLVDSFGGLINSLIPILIAIALVVFFFGLVKYVWGSGGAERQKQGRSVMIAGLVALFVMVSVYGIIRLMQDALALDTNTSIDVPRPPGY